jgi:hypothetical protein
MKANLVPKLTFNCQCSQYRNSRSKMEIKNNNDNITVSTLFTLRERE